jgi:protease-4
MTPENLMNTMWSDMIANRKKERTRAYLKYFLVGAVAIGYGIVLLHGFASAKTAPTGQYVSLVRISGEILADKEASAATLHPVLERAFKDENAKGVVLVINSPGGAPVQSSLIHDQIVSLKGKYRKPVVAVGEDLMASGAYLVAVAADTIVVNRSTITGSIGVISRSFGFTGLMEKLGVERRVQTAGESKNMLDPFGPQTGEDKAKQAGLLAAIHEHFKDTVKEGRGARLTLSTPGLFSGTVWTGEEAVQIGLADTLGSVDTAIATLGATEIKEYAPSRSFMESVLSNVGVKIIQEISPRVTAPLMLSE